MGTISIRPNETTAHQIELIQQRHGLGTAAKAVTRAVDFYLEALATAETWERRCSLLAGTAAGLAKSIDDRRDADRRIAEGRKELDRQLEDVLTHINQREMRL